MWLFSKRSTFLTLGQPVLTDFKARRSSAKRPSKHGLTVVRRSTSESSDGVMDSQHAILNFRPTSASQMTKRLTDRYKIEYRCCCCCSQTFRRSTPSSVGWKELVKTFVYGHWLVQIVHSHDHRLYWISDLRLRLRWQRDRYKIEYRCCCCSYLFVIWGALVGLKFNKVCSRESAQ